MAIPTDAARGRAETLAGLPAESTNGIGAAESPFVEELGEEARKALGEIRSRVKATFDADPEFAHSFGRPLAEDPPEPDLVKRLRAGEFRK